MILEFLKHDAGLFSGGNIGPPALEEHFAFFDKIWYTSPSNLNKFVMKDIDDGEGRRRVTLKKSSALSVDVSKTLIPDVAASS